MLPALSRASMSLRMALTRSWFSTASPLLVTQSFLIHVLYQSTTQLIEYLLSVKICTDCVLPTTWSARRIAVSSARWFVCGSPLSRSEMFLCRAFS